MPAAYRAAQGAFVGESGAAGDLTERQLRAQQELFDAFPAYSLGQCLVRRAAVGESAAQGPFARRVPSCLFAEGRDHREALRDGHLQDFEEVLLVGAGGQLGVECLQGRA